MGEAEGVGDRRACEAERDRDPANRIDRVGLLFAEFASHDALKASYDMFAARSAYRTGRSTTDRI
jgi:hypothetical protein